MHSVVFGKHSRFFWLERTNCVANSGIMIVIVGYKTRSVIKVRVTDPAVLKDVRLLAVFGASTDSSAMPHEETAS
jgi:hypothetical protein